VATEDARKQTERILPWLGWRLTRDKDGSYSIEPGTQAIDAQRQRIPAALGIDEIGLQEAIESGREYQFEILTEDARFTRRRGMAADFPGHSHASRWRHRRRAHHGYPAGEILCRFGSYGPETAAGLMTAVGLP